MDYPEQQRLNEESRFPSSSGVMRCPKWWRPRGQLQFDPCRVSRGTLPGIASGDDVGSLGFTSSRNREQWGTPPIFPGVVVEETWWSDRAFYYCSVTLEPPPCSQYRSHWEQYQGAPDIPSVKGGRMEKLGCHPHWLVPPSPCQSGDSR